MRDPLPFVWRLDWPFALQIVGHGISALIAVGVAAAGGGRPASARIGVARASSGWGRSGSGGRSGGTRRRVTGRRTAPTRALSVGEGGTKPDEDRAGGTN
jgi:hypothetical protein